MVMLLNVEKEIKDIEKEFARLSSRKQELLEKEQFYKEMDSKLESIFTQSGFATPKEFVLALANKYNVRIEKKAEEGEPARRKRTRITKELRDAIKGFIAQNNSMNAAARQFNLSYAVVVKINKGIYDNIG